MNSVRIQHFEEQKFNLHNLRKWSWLDVKDDSTLHLMASGFSYKLHQIKIIFISKICNLVIKLIIIF